MPPRLNALPARRRPVTPVPEDPSGYGVFCAGYVAFKKVKHEKYLCLGIIPTLSLTNGPWICISTVKFVNLLTTSGHSGFLGSSRQDKEPECTDRTTEEMYVRGVILIYA